MRVNEIFYSLQGEGFHTGTPAVFIRLSGCNLACPFCDTSHASGTDMTHLQIVEEVGRYAGVRHVVITGGEPTLQADDRLVELLHRNGHFVQIETNGTRPVPKGIDWITCSPKEGPYALTDVDELKVVYQGQDVEAIAALFNTRNLLLQPCSCSNTSEVVEYIKRHPHWRMSLQTHKLIDIP
ncbi:MAG: 7-carboxy-7-deazaguanine synthase QueE [Muribaculaceae bacterium]|nr:7-carboxy-7-deazaguanine synthase QueE [Muribaculaceae bacterium]